MAKLSRRIIDALRPEDRDFFVWDSQISGFGVRVMSSRAKVLAEVERDGSEAPYIVTAFRLLIPTGCRLGEIQTLKWKYIATDGMERPDSRP
ncbi:site-specific integrase [Sedimentitalea nanhaiensis]|uniref:Phage integrase family protein n=1 Tax=Sedimentitalea nanhaiensis TaxID=999627 RepID=A0A1I7BW16_9RHOB|nr:hypothetical protein [Sedimentitalea nanhaiensis]SFT91365.1 hypothetical protein SAMN05216236_11282 [Sedimentitalea nanhaiensis]